MDGNLDPILLDCSTCMQVTHNIPHRPMSPSPISSQSHSFGTKNAERKSRTSGSSTHAQKFETTVVVNGYKNGSSLKLRINWKWPESVFLVLTKRIADSGDDWSIPWSPYAVQQITFQYIKPMNRRNSSVKSIFL